MHERRTLMGVVSLSHYTEVHLIPGPSGGTLVVSSLALNEQSPGKQEKVLIKSGTTIPCLLLNPGQPGVPHVPQLRSVRSIPSMHS